MFGVLKNYFKSVKALTGDSFYKLFLGYIYNCDSQVDWEKIDYNFLTSSSPDSSLGIDFVIVLTS